MTTKLRAASFEDGRASITISWQPVVTASTLTAVAFRGYWINTTSNTCLVTLPSSANVGDTIVIIDYAGTFATNNIMLTSSLKIQGGTANKAVTTNREGLTLTFADSTQGWVVKSGVNSGSQGLDPVTYSVDFLVIAGGASGGQENFASGSGGGGGAGGYRTSTQTGLTTGNTITVTVGDGGAARNQGGGKGASGSDSSISGTGLTTITSAGGGGGGGGTNSGNSAAVAGGSGGGGTNSHASSGASGNTPSTNPSQGNAGGNLGDGDKAGGGGGAGGAGGNGSGSAGGAGGAGAASSITGSSVTRAGGGGGNAGSADATAGAAGTGGGGSGAKYQVVAATNGTVNTGGGGGGATNGGSPNYSTTGAGGKGVVILSMPDINYSGTTTGSPTVATGVSGKTVLTFTGSGSYTL